MVFRGHLSCVNAIMRSSGTLFAFIGFISIINGPLGYQVKYGKAIRNVLIAEDISITLFLPSHHHTVHTSSVLLCRYVCDDIVFLFIVKKWWECLSTTLLKVVLLSIFVIFCCRN